MAVDLFAEIGVLILISAIGGALAIRFKQPAVLGLLFIGAIAGPGVLGLVTQTETISLFADIGAVLLLFTIGIEFSVSKLLRGGIRVFMIAGTKLALVFLLSYELSLLLGLDKLAALYLGVIISITSTALFIRFVEQKRMAQREEVPLLVGMLIVEDIFAIFALTFFSSLETAAGLGSLRVLFSIAQSLAVLGMAYLVLSKVLRLAFDWLTRYQAKETMAFASLSLGVGLSYLAQMLGLTPSIGAFLAGSLVASLPRGEELEKAIQPFALVFSSIFFVSMGMFVNPQSLAQNAWLVAILCIASVLFKFMGTTLGTYAFGFSSRGAVFAGLAMLPAGEFSLLAAGIGGTVNGLDLVGITAALVFTSALSTSALIGGYERVHSVLYALTPASFKRAGRRVSFEAHLATNAFEGSSGVYGFFARIASHLADSLAAISVLAGLAAAAWILLKSDTVTLFGVTIGAFWAAALIILVVSVKPALGIARDFSATGSALQRGIERRSGSDHARKLARRFALIAVLVLAVLALPFALEAVEVHADLLRWVPAAFALATIIGFLMMGSDDRKKGVAFFKK